LGFVGCLLAVLWMWGRQVRIPSARGEVEAVRLDIAAGTDGRLVPLSREPWTLFDTVDRGQVVARLDSGPAQAELGSFSSELTRLHKEVVAAEATIIQEQAELSHDHQREVNRLTWQIERHRLDILDRRALIQADRIGLQRLDAQLGFLRPVYERGVTTEMEFVNVKLQRDEIAERIEENRVALREAADQLKAARQRLKEHPPLQTAEAATLLAPFRDAITAQELRVRQLQLQIEALEIRAPITGTICCIYCWPGQNVVADQPILTIAAEHGGCIIAYVHPEQRVPTVGMAVDVRSLASGSPTLAAKVERVGPQFEAVPAHHWENPRIPEWGLPVRITLPERIDARPGELLGVTFKTWTRGDTK